MEGRQAGKLMIKNQEGAVTVYLVIIFMAMVIFIGLFIDMARIKVAESQLRRTADASARSVLADYDSALKRDFGLFAYTKNNHIEEFEKYIRTNISVSQGQEFKLLDLQYEKSEVQLLNTLQMREVLRQQVLEDMKYTAPIELAKFVNDKFAAIKKIFRVFKRQRKNSKLINSCRTNLEKVKEAQDRVVRNRQKLIDSSKLRNAKRLELAGEKDTDKRKGLQKEIDRLNTEMRTAKETVRSDLVKCFELTRKIDAEKRKLQRTGDYGDPDDRETSEGIDSILDENNKSLDLQLAQLEEKLDQTIALINKDVSKCIEALNNEDYLRIQMSVLNFSLYEQDSLAASSYQEKLRQEEAGLRKLLTQQETMGEESIFSSKKFSGSASNFEEKHGKVIDDEVLKKMTELEGIEGLLISARDDLYINEYVLTHFSYLTNAKKTPEYKFYKSEGEYICFGGTSPKAVALSEIYGIRFILDSAAYMAFSKVPVDPVFRLIYSLIMGSLEASVDTLKLVLGQEIPIVSMHDPLTGGKNPLFHIKVNYKEHLRLLLLLHLDEDGKLDRMIEVIGVRNNNSLDGSSTVLRGSIEGSIKMWFLPLAGFDDLGRGPFGTRIKDGRCYITKEVENSY